MGKTFRHVHTTRVSEFYGRVGKWETQFPEHTLRLSSLSAYHDRVKVAGQARLEPPRVLDSTNLFPASGLLQSLGGAALEVLATDPGNDEVERLAGQSSGSLAQAVGSWLGVRADVSLGAGAYELRFTAQSEVYGGSQLLVLVSRDSSYALATAQRERFFLLMDRWRGYELTFSAQEEGRYSVQFFSPEPFALDDLNLVLIAQEPERRNLLPLTMGAAVGKLVVSLNRGREFSTYPLLERRYNTVFGEHDPILRFEIGAEVPYKRAEGYIEQALVGGVTDVLLHFELEVAA